MKHRSRTLADNWMGLSYRPSCKKGSHLHVSICLELIVGAEKPEKAE